MKRNLLIAAMVLLLVALPSLSSHATASQLRSTTQPKTACQ